MHAPIGIFTAIARLLVSAKGREQIPFRIIDLHLTGTHLARNGAGSIYIAGLHIGGKSVNRVIGDVDCLSLILCTA